MRRHEADPLRLLPALVAEPRLLRGLELPAMRPWRLNQLVARELPPLGVAREAAITAPVLQLSAFPNPIDPADYANAFSPTNPSGLLQPLYRFSQMVDPIPVFAPNYWPGLFSIEDVYGDLLTLIVPPADTPDFAVLLNQARLKFATAHFDDLTGTGISFHPSYADPDDWYELRQEYFTAEIDFSNPAAVTQAGFFTIGAPGGEPARSSTSYAYLASDLRSLSFGYAMVRINRPWLDSSILNMISMPNWRASGMQPGHLSSGSLLANSGIFPLLPNAFLLGREFRITARWSERDLSLIDQAVRGHRDVALGGIALSGVFRDSPLRKRFNPVRSGHTLVVQAPQIVAWVSALLPLAPPSGPTTVVSFADDHAGGRTLVGAEYALQGILDISAVRSPGYCGEAVPAILGSGAYGAPHSVLSTGTVADLMRCNTVPLSFRLGTAAREVSVQYYGAAVPYSLGAYAADGQLVAEATALGHPYVYDSPFQVKATANGAVITRFEFGQTSALTMIVSVSYRT